MTSLSRQRAADLCHFSDLTVLARLSLNMLPVMALGGAGCLVTDSPTFEAPRRTPPYLTKLDPSTTKNHTVPEVGTTGIYELARITFDIESEDLGQKIEALLYVDLEGLNNAPSSAAIWGWDIEPATLKAPRPRTTTYEVNFNLLPNPSAPTPAGCRAVTVVASHDFLPGSLQPVERGDVDSATWFFQVGANTANPETYKICEPIARPGDAGADARDGGGR